MFWNFESLPLTPSITIFTKPSTRLPSAKGKKNKKHKDWKDKIRNLKESTKLTLPNIKMTYKAIIISVGLVQEKTNTSMEQSQETDLHI